MSEKAAPRALLSLFPWDVFITSMGCFGQSIPWKFRSMGCFHKTTATGRPERARRPRARATPPPGAPTTLKKEENARRYGRPPCTPTAGVRLFYDGHSGGPAHLCLPLLHEDRMRFGQGGKKRAFPRLVSHLSLSLLHEDRMRFGQDGKKRAFPRHVSHLSLSLPPQKHYAPTL